MLIKKNPNAQAEISQAASKALNDLSIVIKQASDGAKVVPLALTFATIAGMGAHCNQAGGGVTAASVMMAPFFTLFSRPSF